MTASGHRPRAARRRRLRAASYTTSWDATYAPLQYAFRQHHGMTPRAFQRQVRLDHARERLVRPQPGTRVTDVALDSGFGSLGEFAAAYRQRFGELPSETLRRHG